MARHRFYCENLAPGRVVLNRFESRHAAQVLRLRVGTTIDLFDGCGRTALGRIEASAKGDVIVAVEDVDQRDRPSRSVLTLITAMPRAHRQHFLFEKCTELGVARIVPAIFDRSTARPRADATAKWRRIVVEAGKQCGCAHLPSIDPPTPVRQTVGDEIDAAVRLIASAGDPVAPLARILSGRPPVASLAVWIGPEGGLTDAESAAIQAAGATPVSLGPHVLRVETAVVAIAAAVFLNG